MLEDVQKLHGKLLHASLVIPRGHAYLTELEAMISTFSNQPFKPRTPPPHRLSSDLAWWTTCLSSPSCSCPILGPFPLANHGAYSDASSSTGIGIIIAGQWRAWRLLPGWDQDGRDIGWAEAIGFEFLAISLAKLHPTGGHFKVFGDNRGVVEGWWKGRSRNRATNGVFRRILELQEKWPGTLHTRYVPSGHNPADELSHGIYGPSHCILPAIPIPVEIQHIVVDFDAERTPTEQRLLISGHQPAPSPKPA